MKRICLRKNTRRALIGLGLVLMVLVLMLCGSRAGSAQEHGEILSENEDRVRWLEDLGWTVESEPVSRREIIIPRDFGPVLENYNDLQKQQGYDLADYQGLTATLYTYRVTNWPEKELTVLADIYIYRNRVIAGDIHSTAVDGFMIALR